MYFFFVLFDVFVLCDFIMNRTDTIYWEREGFDMSRTRTTFKGRADEKTATSFLTIFNVSKADIGVFNCIANNRLVTTSAQRGAMLVVNCK